MCPTFLKFGGFVIYWYGIMVALGVLVSALLFQRFALKDGYTREDVSGIVFWTVVWGIIGARTVHVFAHLSYYFFHPLEIIMIRNGGLAIQGAFIAALFFLTIYLRLRNLRFFKTLDLVALVTPLGQAVGRIGCFLNGCCYGRPTESLFGVKFPFLDVRVHPTQLYYSALSLVLFAVLLTIYRARHKDGEVVAVFLILSGLGRYLMDFTRGDLAATPLALNATQFFGIVFFILGAVYLFFLWREKDPDVPAGG